MKETTLTLDTSALDADPLRLVLLGDITFGQVFYGSINGIATRLYLCTPDGAVPLGGDGCDRIVPFSKLTGRVGPEVAGYQPVLATLVLKPIPCSQHS